MEAKPNSMANSSCSHFHETDQRRLLGMCMKKQKRPLVVEHHKLAAFVDVRREPRHTRCLSEASTQHPHLDSIRRFNSIRFDLSRFNLIQFNAIQFKGEKPQGASSSSSSAANAATNRLIPLQTFPLLVMLTFVLVLFQG